MLAPANYYFLYQELCVFISLQALKKVAYEVGLKLKPTLFRQLYNRACRWRYTGHVQLAGGLEVDPEHAGGITYLLWPGKRLRVPQEELESVAGERDVWYSLLSLLPLQPGRG